MRWVAMDRDGVRRGLRIDAALAAAVDHVRLCYVYLDTGDLDGYASLFEAGTPPMGSGGGAAVPEMLAWLLRSGSSVHHAVIDVFGSDRRLAAVYRLTVGGETYDLVDIFRVSDHALFVDRQCFATSWTPWSPPPAHGDASS
ncbi:hypothetical protein MRQ36_28430 [Micromonospora sp. R77]|uniref:hypothetical protein n=1 Tax=Micromonospora sp. R77 TaxID=2925836 RepID=UPI001F621E4B|nr:hypothetical protein [Micromonospora sp. R77]MCI4066266.1 hypothetical protein [Micromonospora sp. R77]